MENKVVIGVISAFVVVTMLAMVLMPVIDANTQRESITNDGAGWLRMEYNTGGSYSVAADAISSDDGLLVYNGTDSQIGADDTIIYASSNLTAWIQDGLLQVLGTNDDGIFYAAPEESFMITRDSTGVSLAIDSEETTYSFSSPTWAYVPKSTGNYGFFENGTPVKLESDKPLAIAGGGFAGVYATDNTIRYNELGLQLMTTIDDDGMLIAAYWEKASESQEEIQVFDPSQITFDPIDPGSITIDPIDPGMQIMSVPTPTYTDGDWGYDTMSVDGVTKAKIVSYSGAGGGAITVPSTVGGYDVYQFGMSFNNATVFDTAFTATDLILSEGIVEVGVSACQGCTGFTGSLVLPSTLTTINGNAFKGCTGFTGSLVLPESLTTLNASAFENCSGFTGSLALPDSITTFGNSVFSGCTGLTGSIDIPESVTTMGTHVFAGCTGLTGSIILPEGLTSIGNFCFYQCSGFTGALIVPASVTSIGMYAFGSTRFTDIMILSDATPGNYAFSTGNYTTSVLDMSETIDYSTTRYGIGNGAAVQDNIGDAIGYISFIEIGTDAPLSGSAATLLMIIPAIVVISILVAAVVWFIYNRY